MREIRELLPAYNAAAIDSLVKLAGPKASAVELFFKSSPISALAGPPPLPEFCGTDSLAREVLELIARNTSPSFSVVRWDCLHIYSSYWMHDAAVRM